MSKFTTSTWSILMATAIAMAALSLYNGRHYELTVAFKHTPNRSPPIHTQVLPQVRILSYEPHIMHIRDFISPSERAYLLELSKPLLQPSVVGTTHRLSEGRTSHTAFLEPDEDPVVRSIAERASEFQGFLDIDYVTVQVTSYQPGQQYRAHYDWWGDLKPNATRDRLSTFFAILEADCSNCGTEFLNVPVDWSQKDNRWCDVVDCTKDVLTSRNVPGSALYWRNLDENGDGRQDTLHAGLPAINGTKVGLNIWTSVDITGEFFGRPARFLTEE